MTAQITSPTIPPVKEDTPQGAHAVPSYIGTGRANLEARYQATPDTDEGVARSETVITPLLTTRGSAS